MATYSKSPVTNPHSDNIAEDTDVSSSPIVTTPRFLISYFGGARGFAAVIGYTRQYARRVPIISLGCGSDVGAQRSCCGS